MPASNAVYYYPSVTGSLIFSELIQQSWLSFGKVRLNYAQVGNSAGFDLINDSYTISTPLNNPSSSVALTKKNPDLKAEQTKNLEAGLEMYFLEKRVGFDLALYKGNTTDQILPLSISTAAGYDYKIINAGEIENKGIELQLFLVPVKVSDFKWDLTFNWSKNVNKVLSLAPGIDNYQLGTFQEGVTINARVGQPYGMIQGSDYTYKNGQRIINDANGRYVVSTTSDHILGKVAPDWKGGIMNSFSYKNWRLSGLIDISKGGHIWSLDMCYGLATGLYPETAGNNDLGNPLRNPIVWVDENDPSKGYDKTSGGLLYSGVNVDAAGNVTPNKTRISAVNFGAQGYRYNPNAAFTYNAGYVKLREVSLTYSLPSTMLQKFFIKGVDLSVVGSNLWIIKKYLPYADPESSLGAGNLMGYSIGSIPSTKDIGFNVKLTF